MTYMPKLDRRTFVVGSTAAGLSLGFHIPFSGDAQAQAVGPEVNAWVVVHPDETVTIRVARSEMGQGTLTGLCQMVAEELECEWSKVSYEFPTAGQNVARKRIWADFFTAGSRGIRASQEVVRKGGAAARVMLIQAGGSRGQGSAHSSGCRRPLPTLRSARPHARPPGSGRGARRAARRWGPR